MNRKHWLAIIPVLAGLAVIGFGLHNDPMHAATAPGTGALSGTVKAQKEFKAAKVYARNIDKNVTYMVFTQNGRYRLVDLFPGNYEVTVDKNGFSGETQTIAIQPGATATANFVLQDGAFRPAQGARANQPKNVPLVSYDELYPPGEGRDLIERTCIRCHGPDWLPSKQWNATQWNAGIDMMESTTNERPGRISATSVSPPLTAHDRQVIVDYLAKNFGPNSTVRGLAVPDMPADEEALGKAMFIEYHLPPLPNSDRQRRLHDPHLGKNGEVWYVDTSGMQIGKLDPRTGTFTDYPIRNPKMQGHGITQDASGEVWYAGDQGCGRVDSKTGEMTFYLYETDPVRPPHGNTPAIDSHQNVWTTLSWSNSVAKWDRKTQQVTNFKVPTPFTMPYGAVMDKKDNFWVAEWLGCKMAKFDTKTEKFTEYLPLYKPCTMRRLSVDHNGMVWYALDSVGKVGTLDPNSGKVIAEYALPVKGSFPYDIQEDHTGNFWIADSGQGGALIKFDPHTKKFTYYPAVQRTDMPKIEVSAQNSIWYTTRGADPGKDQALGVLYPDMDKITTLGAYY